MLTVAASEATPAGLRVRFRAFLLDYIPILAYLLVLLVAGALLRTIWPAAVRTLFGGPWVGEASGCGLWWQPTC